MPYVALFICIAFVHFLLRLERKQSLGVSSAIWIPTIWILYVSSKPLAQWIKYSATTPESSPLDRTFTIILICLALWILSQKKFDWSLALKENPWLVVLASFMLVSILWSNIPGISLKRWIRETPTILMAFVVLTEASPRKAMESILRRSTFILIPFSLLLIKFFPEYGVEYGRWSGIQMWIGVTTQKNGLGRLCVISAFFLIWSLVRRRQGINRSVEKYQTYMEIFVLLITIFIMRGPGGNFFYSATSMYAMIMGLLSYLGLLLVRKSAKSLRFGIVAAVVVFIIITGYLALFNGGSNAKLFTSTAGRESTLTGRTEVWAALLPIALQQPLLGRGYGGFWTPATRDAFKISEAHSGYLDVLLELGFVGVILLSMFLLSSSRKAQRELSRDYDWGMLWISYIIMALVQNLTESSINSLYSHMSAVIIFFSVYSTSIFSRRKNIFTV